MKNKGKVRTKSANMTISGIFAAFSAGEKFSRKIGLGHIMDIANTHLCAKNWKKLIMKSWEKAKKRFSRHISDILDQKNMFFKNWARSHFRHYHFASVCKISWINVEYSSRNSRNTVFPAIFRKFRLQKSV